MCALFLSAQTILGVTYILDPEVWCVSLLWRHSTLSGSGKEAPKVVLGSFSVGVSDMSACGRQEAGANMCWLLLKKYT